MLPRQPERVLILEGASGGPAWELLFPTARCRRADPVALPDSETGETWDLVVSWQVAQRDPWQRWRLQQWTRLLTPGRGVLLICTRNRTGWVRLVGGPLRRMRRWLQRCLGMGGVTATGAYATAAQWQSVTAEVLGHPGCWQGDGERCLRAWELLPESLRQRWAPLLWGVLEAPAPLPVFRWPAFVQRGDFVASMQERWGDWLEALPVGVLRQPGALGALPVDPATLPGPVLVLSPHPDDEIIGCGGTLLALRALGRDVHVLHLTDGRHAQALAGLPETARCRVRYDEARQVARRAGFVLHLWENSPDGALMDDTPGRERLAALVAQCRPRLVLVPSSQDRHPDHRATHALWQAVRRNCVPSPRVLEYPVWGLVAANRQVDVTVHHAAQMALLAQYATGMKSVDFMGWCRDWQSWHGAVHPDGSAVLREVFHEDGGEISLSGAGRSANPALPPLVFHGDGSGIS
ncbi:MAG: PIG-L family deacetylase [Magnetococcus sp. WYHC-3]